MSNFVARYITVNMIYLLLLTLVSSILSSSADADTASIDGGIFNPEVTESDVSYVFYNRQDDVGTPVNNTQSATIQTITAFNPAIPTYFLIHGWDHYCNSTFDVVVREAILTKHDVNVLHVCWDGIANLNYIASALSTEKVGTYVGNFILGLAAANSYSLDDITIVGHSLGAHIAGKAGETTGGTVGIIMGLDPAAPLFYSFVSTSDRLDKTDAKYVQSIHTDSIKGVTYNVGHADFWPNGGFLQNGCSSTTCSHARAYLYYAESVAKNNFEAVECHDFLSYEFGICSHNKKAFMGGIPLDPSIRGTFYLSTNADSPYARG